MHHVTLTHEEREILSQVLQNSLATLQLEIRHTDHLEFRNLLKHRRDAIQSLIAKTQQPMAAAA